MTNTNKQVLIDSDFWVGLFLENDAHHQTTLEAMNTFISHRKQLVTTNIVIAETLTVLSHKSGQQLARTFYQHFKKTKTPTLFVDEKIDEEARMIFLSQDKRGTSYGDCANVMIMKAYGIKEIYAFDKVYHKVFRLKNLAYPQVQAA